MKLDTILERDYVVVSKGFITPLFNPHEVTRQLAWYHPSDLILKIEKPGLTFEPYKGVLYIPKEAAEYAERINNPKPTKVHGVLSFWR